MLFALKVRLTVMFRNETISKFFGNDYSYSFFHGSISFDCFEILTLRRKIWVAILSCQTATIMFFLEIPHILEVFQASSARQAVAGLG